MSHEETTARQSQLSELNATELRSKLFELLNELNGGNYFHRFHEIAKERGSPLVKNSHFYKLDTASLQLLIETIQKTKHTEG